MRLRKKMKKYFFYKKAFELTPWNILSSSINLNFMELVENVHVVWFQLYLTQQKQKTIY